MRAQLTLQGKEIDGLKRDASLQGIRWDIATLVAVAAVWLVWTAFAVTTQGTWLDETNYIVRAWWYVSGLESPYGATDATRYVPLHFLALGFWQSLFGHDVVTSRLWSVFLTGISICLLATLIRRLRGTWWAAAFAILIFVLSEESTFYFSSATPYALVVFLQLCALNVVINIERGRIWLRAIVLGVLLTALYLTRPEMMPFIALILGTILVRLGRSALSPIATIGVIFLSTYGALAHHWGRKFIFVSLYFPAMTEVLIKSGVLPELFPNAVRFSQTAYYDQPASLHAMIESAFRLEIVRDWVAWHHLPQVAAAVFAVATLVVFGIVRLKWLSFFTTAYWLGLLYYLVAGQLQCSICVQAYLNYVDYLAAISGGLALQAILDRTVRSRARLLTAAFASVILVVVAQSFLIGGRLKLPSAFHQNASLPKQVDLLAARIRDNIRADVPIAIVGADNRLLLALTAGDVKFSAWSIVMPFNYRRIAAGLAPDEIERTRQEIEALTDWTDLTADRWLSNDYQRIVVLDLPRTPRLEWMIWHPDAPKVVSALSRCFEREQTISVGEIDPPMTLSVYRRRISGEACSDSTRSAQ
jgi:hypothetical protein